MLAAANVLAVSDSLALAELCRDLAALETIDRAIATEGPLRERHAPRCRSVTKADAECSCGGGVLVENPLLRARDRVWRRVHALFCDFGMNPTSRARVSTVAPPPSREDAAAARFFGPRRL